MPTSALPSKAYVGILACLLGVVVFYATYRLTESPPTWYDEGIYIQVAQSFGERGEQTVQVAPGEFRQIDFLTVGYPLIAPVAASLKLFGNSLLAARIPMVLFIILFALSAWVLLVRVAGSRNALLGLALLATFPIIYGNGKNVLGEIPGLFYSMLALLALHRLGERNFEGIWHYVFLGLTTGLVAATKPIFLLMPAAIGLVLLFHVRSIPLHVRNIGAALVAFIAPLALWMYLQFGHVDPSLILSYYANPYGVASIPETVMHNLIGFFTETTPLYCAALMLVWTAGLLIRLYQKGQISLVEKSAFVFAVMVLFAYLRTAGWYRYLFQAMVFALLFMPQSLQVLAEAAGQRRAYLRPYATFGVIFIVAALTLMQFYQLNYASWVAEHYNTTRTAQMIEYFSSFPENKSIFIYNSPAAVIFLPTTKYYQYLQPTETILYGEEQLHLIEKGVPDIILLSHEAYEQKQALFSGYHESGMAAAYLMLERK
ncbi:MAG: glycosyltransferase family 39 protein [Patescibacteria group bacterium]